MRSIIAAAALCVYGICLHGASITQSVRVGIAEGPVTIWSGSGEKLAEFDSAEFSGNLHGDMDLSCSSEFCLSLEYAGHGLSGGGSAIVSTPPQVRISGPAYGWVTGSVNVLSTLTIADEIRFGAIAEPAFLEYGYSGEGEASLWLSNGPIASGDTVSFGAEAVNGYLWYMGMNWGSTAPYVRLDYVRLVDETGSPLSGFTYTSALGWDYPIEGGMWVAHMPEPGTWALGLAGVLMGLLPRLLGRARLSRFRKYDSERAISLTRRGCR